MLQSPSLRDRMDMLEEGIQVIRALESGNRVSLEGRHFKLKDAEMHPTPAQQPIDRHRAASAQAGEVIGEVGELRLGHIMQRLDHRRFPGVPRVALVFLERFQQVVLALVGEPRHGLLPGKIRAMTNIEGSGRRRNS